MPGGRTARWPAKPLQCSHAAIHVYIYIYICIMCICIYYYMYISLSLYIYIYRYLSLSLYIANLRTKILDCTGFGPSIILILRGGSLMPIGNFLESLSQAILAGIILGGRSGVDSSFIVIYVYRHICLSIYLSLSLSIMYIYIYICLYTHVAWVGRQASGEPGSPGSLSFSRPLSPTEILFSKS